MYLNRELQSIPHDWPLIAIGYEAYKAMAYIHPSRIVIGIPHPTASRGQFSKLFDQKKLRHEFRLFIDDWWDGKARKAGWADTSQGHYGYR
ncbi:MAG: hypothetical protein HYY30_02670 [Chloroflexi bacterium]|nr:hypothetical protein [Chloroflexota bacterium]